MSDYVVLKSGKQIYANYGFVGINDTLELAQGYDGGMPCVPIDEDYSFNDWGEKLTKNEALELADLMIDRWKKFREAVDKT